MQITPINFGFNGKVNNSNTFDKKVTSKQDQQMPAVETAGTVGIFASEVLGRSMVNFCGKIGDKNKLTEADNNFAEGIGQIYRLDKGQVKEVKTIIRDFLKKNGFKEIGDMQSDDIFEYANESACLSEKLSRSLNLTDYEDTVMTFLVTHQVNIGDMTKFKGPNGTLLDTNKYTRDYTPIENVLNQYGVDDYEQVSAVFNYLSKMASSIDCDSIFDMFNSENLSFAPVVMEGLSETELENVDSDKITDMLIDFIKLAGKSTEGRLDGINRRKEEEKFNDGVASLILADKIANKFDIDVTKKLLEILDTRKTETEVHKDGASLIEVAYKISEDFDLPGSSTDEIIKIIEDYQKQTNEEKFNDLVDAFKRNREIKE